MPKAERGSLKDIGKRIKMKGLQKLKYYCQICEKQCRDANGFKCHISSENHLQQMKIFSSNATKIMDTYSTTFEKYFISTLRMRHSTSKVAANTVYQEMIQDKQHIHMNATIWTTLCDFVKYLGKTGQCIVEDTERGWYITYIERDMKKILHIEQTQRRMDAEIAAEQEYQQRIEQQIRMAAVADNNYNNNSSSSTTTNNTAVLPQPTKLQRSNLTDDDPNNIINENGSGGTTSTTIQLSLRTNNTNKKKASIPTTSTTKKSVFDDDDDDDDDDENDKVNVSHNKATTTTVPHPKELLRLQSPNTTSFTIPSTTTTTSTQQRTSSPIPVATIKEVVDNTKGSNIKKSISNDDNGDVDQPPWIYPNIMVRIINQTLGNGKYYRQKGHITKIDPKNPYVAQVQLHSNIDTLVLLQLDQDDLETVTPKKRHYSREIREMIRIVKGPYAGQYGMVLTLNKTKYQATIELKNNLHGSPPPSNNNNNEHYDHPNNQRPKILENVDYDDFSIVYEPPE